MTNGALAADDACCERALSMDDDRAWGIALRPTTVGSGLQKGALVRAIAVIPARLGSSRFPGKPLAEIQGLSMIEHVYRRTEMCGILSEVYVATCDETIRAEVQRFGGRAIMTSAAHERASDRVAEAAKDMDADIVVMVQGDEPLIVPEMIDLAVEPLIEDHTVVCSNLARRIVDEQEYRNPNTIKVVMDRRGFALYFSREPIPTDGVCGVDNIAIHKQVCVIPFRKDFLATFAELEPTPLEQAESIDMLRALEHGYGVKLVETHYDSHAVDTPEDAALVSRLMKDDRLFASYRTSFLPGVS